MTAAGSTQRTSNHLLNVLRISSAPGPHNISRAPGITIDSVPSCHHHKRNPQQRTRHIESWRPLGRGLVSGRGVGGGAGGASDMKAGCCAGIKRIHRKAREGRKDNVVSASRSLRPLRCII
jgi:hypothetical protein